MFWFFFLGLVPSILGHNTLNYAVKYLSPTAVASIPLGTGHCIFPWFDFVVRVNTANLYRRFIFFECLFYN